MKFEFHIPFFCVHWLFHFIALAEMRILHLFICAWAVVSYLNDGLVTAAAVGVVHSLAYVALNACIFHNITSHRWYYSLCRFCRFIRAFSNQNFYNFKGCRAACPTPSFLPDNRQDSNVSYLACEITSSLLTEALIIKDISAIVISPSASVS